MTQLYSNSPKLHAIDGRHWLSAARLTTILMILCAVFAIGSEHAIGRTAQGDLPESFNSKSAEEQAFVLLREYAEAIGGLERVREVKSISSLAEIEVRRGNDPHARPFTLIDSVVEVYPDQRISYTSPMGGDEMLMVTVLDGRDAWTVRKGEYEMQTDDKAAATRAGMLASTIPILSAIDDPYYEVRYDGEEQIAERDFFKLTFTLPEGEQFAWYLDPDTYLVKAQHDFFGESPGLIFIGEYDQIDGLKMPVTAAFQGDRGSMKFTLYWLEINAPYDSTVFDQPGD